MALTANEADYRRLPKFCSLGVAPVWNCHPCGKPTRSIFPKDLFIKDDLT